jgi:hypothetical protein
MSPDACAVKLGSILAARAVLLRRTRGGAQSERAEPSCGER